MIVIDRFEGNIAVLESEGEIIEVDRAEIPDNAAEGDILRNDGGVWTVDPDGTAQRRTQLRDRLRRLTEND